MTDLDEFTEEELELIIRAVEKFKSDGTRALTSYLSDCTEADHLYDLAHSSIKKLLAKLPDSPKEQ